ncbi:unnamed protein product [Sphagnum balticum]
MRLFLLVLLLAIASIGAGLGVEGKTGPIYDYPYQVPFDETYVVDGKSYTINGQYFFDPKNARERLDRVNGVYNDMCNSIVPDLATPCQQIIKDNRRWFLFPRRNYCCFCCDSEHGCGVVKPDWLADSEYLGQEKLNDTLYDKWSKDSKYENIKVNSGITISMLQLIKRFPVVWTMKAETSLWISMWEVSKIEPPLSLNLCSPSLAIVVASRLQ